MSRVVDDPAMELDHPKKATVSIDEALQKLIDGNERFVAGHARFSTVCKETLADLAKAQHPYCTILGCSDSRVPPELVFDADFGELFIVRVAGNVISPGDNGKHSVRRFSLAHSAIRGLGS